MSFSRRSFLKSVAFSGAPLILSDRVWASADKPNEIPNVAVIGMGMQGRGLLGAFLGQPVHVTAICDVDTNRRNWGIERVNKYYTEHPERGTAGNVKGYNDFREIAANKDIDLVVVAVPDHWHAFMTIAMMRGGKDVYCEKPMTYNIHEAVEVMRVSKETGRIVQCGAMQRSGLEFRTACELVRNGAIGKITHVDCHFGGPSQPHFDPKEPQEMEPGLDWQLWLGCAPDIPYNPDLSPRGVHTKYYMLWRMDDLFGSGFCGDWGAHHLDIAQWGLGMDDSGPVKLEKGDRAKFASKDPVRGGRAQHGALVTYANGVTLLHKPWGTWGTVFHGTEGTVSVNRGKFEMKRGEETIARFTKKEDGGSLERACATAAKAFLKDAKVQLYKTRGGHPGDFVTCAKNRTQPCSHVGIGAHSAILCHLFNMSYVHDASFEWDPVKNTFANGTGDPSWLTRNYRGIWKV